MKLLVYKLKGKSHLRIYLGRRHNCSLTRPIMFGTSQIKQEYNYCKRLASIGEESPVIFFSQFCNVDLPKVPKFQPRGFFFFSIFF
jgi:hypothetical protein